MTDTPTPNRYAIFLREKAKAFNLAYIKQDLGYAADEIDRLERDLAACREKLRQAEARAEEAEKDAKRYRVLRDRRTVMTPRVLDPLCNDVTYTPEGLDEACDDAIAAIDAAKKEGA